MKHQTTQNSSDDQTLENSPILFSQNNSSATTISASDFLPAIVHELKNPLNAILGFSQILSCEVAKLQNSENCVDYSKEISIAASELNDLINDLLDVAAAKSGQLSVDLSKKISLPDIIRRSVRLNYDYAAKRNIVIKTEISPEINLVQLDAKRMKQILSNLISNSIKYSPNNTEVKISAYKIFDEIKNRKYLEIKVRDQGFGMTESQIKTAFVKYKTINNPNRGKVDSFGLGLPITKQLVEAQKGKINIISQPQKGSEISLRFPL